jgi:predicted small secreted protein
MMANRHTMNRKIKGKTMPGRFMAVLSMIAALVVLTGCNTVAGFGQDITGSARAVQHAF